MNEKIRKNRASIDIVVPLGKGDARDCAVLLRSIFVNNADTHFRVFLLIGSAKIPDLKNLTNMITGAGYLCETKSLDDCELPEEIKKVIETSRNPWFLALVADLFVDSNRVLLLHPGLLVTGELSGIWNLPLDSHLFAGVSDDKIGRERSLALGIPVHFKYLSTEIMLVNLKSWRTQSVAERLINFVARNTNKLELNDQDAINGCLFTEVFTLDSQWKIFGSNSEGGKEANSDLPSEGNLPIVDSRGVSSALNAAPKGATLPYLIETPWGTTSDRIAYWKKRLTDVSSLNILIQGLRRFRSAFKSIVAENEMLWLVMERFPLLIPGSIERRRRNYLTYKQTLQKIKTRDEKKNEMVQTVISFAPELTVLYGPFSGMKYPFTRSVGSAFPPKILGCYERELHDVIEDICAEPFSRIVDIGCAEGYYAVGLAMRIPDASVYAFDIKVNAIKYCTTLAKANGVSERLYLGTLCDGDNLTRITKQAKSLIICDCEGCELEIFTEAVVSLLTRCTLLIETHDFVDPEISSILKERFSKTHQITSVFSVDDNQKAYDYKFPEIEMLSFDVKKRLLKEGRRNVMEWLYLRPND